GPRHPRRAAGQCAPPQPGARSTVRAAHRYHEAVSTPRPRAEDFLELVQRARRGRLKLYIGFAAGVGKTVRMLEEAHALKKRGVDVVLGFIETHLRAETHALIAGLELIPRRKIEYRGVVVDEMDLDAVLERKPSIAVV